MKLTKKQKIKIREAKNVVVKQGRSKGKLVTRIYADGKRISERKWKRNQVKQTRKLVEQERIEPATVAAMTKPPTNTVQTYSIEVENETTGSKAVIEARIYGIEEPLSKNEFFMRLKEQTSITEYERFRFWADIFEDSHGYSPSINFGKDTSNNTGAEMHVNIMKDSKNNRFKLGSALK